MFVFRKQSLLCENKCKRKNIIIIYEKRNIPLKMIYNLLKVYKQFYGIWELNLSKYFNIFNYVYSYYSFLSYKYCFLQLNSQIEYILMGMF
jgi:hypothetical protein